MIFFLTAIFLFLILLNPAFAVEEEEFLKYCCFQNPKDLKASSYLKDDTVFIEWNKKEKEAVFNALRRVYNKEPRLVTVPAQRGKIVLASCKDLSYLALTNSFFNVIKINDVFQHLGYTKAESTVAHELVHLLDLGYRVSYSKQWADFCGETIRDIKFESQFHDDSYKSHMHRLERWPSYYGSQNLSEALCEYAADRLYKPKNSRYKLILNNLFDSSEQTKLWKIYLSDGYKSYFTGNYRNAESNFKSAVKIQSTAPIQYLLADCNFRQNFYSKAQKEADRGLLMLDELRDYPNSEYRLKIKLLKLKCYSKQKVLDKNLAFVDDMTKLWPLKRELYKLKAKSIEKTKNKKGEWLMSLYKSKGYLGDYITPVVDYKNNPELIRTTINTIVASNPRSGNALRYRAQYLENLSCSKKQKKANLNAALSDYKASLKYKDSPKLDSMMRCAFICHKLKNYEQFEYWIKRARNKSRKAILPQIAEIMLLEATRKYSEANSRSETLHKKIETLKIVKEEIKNEKTFPTLKIQNPIRLKSKDSINIG